MNLEEAKSNIGKEVIFIGERASGHTKLLGNNIVIDSADDHHAIIMSGNGHKSFINLREIKLKEQPMQNYKIKVTPETSAEVQELFFELGYGWNSGNNIPKYKNNRYIHTISKNIIVTNCEEVYTELNATEITLPQLRDLVVLKRNDVGDATHISQDGEMYYIANDVFIWQDEKWDQSPIVTPKLTPITKGQPQMTWQDALRAVADGKEMEAHNGRDWISVAFLSIEYLQGVKKFRLKPQTIHVDGGDYTKEELLKIAGEME